MVPALRPLSSLAVFRVVLLTLLALASCRGQPTLTATTAAVPAAIADPSTRVLVARLLEIQGEGSPASIEAVPEGTLLQGLRSGEGQIAFGLGTPPERLWAAQLGWEGILVIVHAGNPLRSITLAQLRDVFSGKTTDWSQLGFSAGSIRLIAREKGSPVRMAFDQAVLDGGMLSSESLIAPASWAVVQAIRGDPLAIGYLPCSDSAVGLGPLEINGVSPSGGSVQRGDYVLRIPVVALARERPAGPWASFLTWAQSERGQQAFRDLCHP
jgi:phosphate transport system substrate-binding protein